MKFIYVYILLIFILFNRYNDLYRELQRDNIRDSVVRLILINEQHAAHYFTADYFDKIRLFQDNPKDRLVKKLSHRGQKINNYVFGR